MAEASAHDVTAKAAIPRRHEPGCIPSGEASFSEQLWMMWRAFLGSPLRKLLFWVSFGIFALIVATAFGQVLLNRWNQPFYDAIERKNVPDFLNQLVIFGYIAGVLLLLNVMQGWLNRYLHIKLREGLVRDLFDHWLKPGRALKLHKSGEIGVNPDQRLHEDAWHLADLSADLGIGFVQASVLLVSFIGVLWAISEGFVFHYDGRSFSIPGYMVWAALAYAGVASGISWLLGRPLIRLNADHYAREAELRVALVNASQDVEAISKAGDETATKGKAGGKPQRGAAGDAKDNDGGDPAAVVHGGLWLGDGGCADRHRLAGLFRRRPDVRRPDDGGGGFYPGAFVAALVRRQHRCHRRLAGDAAAGRVVPAGAD
jgi:ABC-type uncharacterized transport system fused permease/ATPase subunit